MLWSIKCKHSEEPGSSKDTRCLALHKLLEISFNSLSVYISEKPGSSKDFRSLALYKLHENSFGVIFCKRIDERYIDKYISFTILSLE